MSIAKSARAAWFLFVLVLILATALPTAASAEANGAAENGLPVPTLRSAACRAVQFLQREQHADGGFGNTAQSSQAVTADVTYVLGLLGEDLTSPGWTASSGKNPLDALQLLTIPDWVKADPGQAGKVARAVAVAGGNPRSFGGLDLVSTIQGFYTPETGLYHQTFLYRHSLAVEGLLRSGAPVPQAAYDALLSSQGSDGGWFWSKGGAQSDVDTTGRVLQVLGRLGHIDAPTAYSKAAAFLQTQELADGGWNTGYTTDPANGNSTALAVGGLLAIGQDPQSAAYTKSAKGALENLLSFQETSGTDAGAFVYIKEAGKQESRIMATADALAVLAPLVEGQPVCQPIYLPMILVR
jgi:hypothetical protein